MGWIQLPCRSSRRLPSPGSQICPTADFGIEDQAQIFNLGTQSDPIPVYTREGEGAFYLLVKIIVSVLEGLTDYPKIPHQSSTIYSAKFGFGILMAISSAWPIASLPEDSSLLRSELTTRFQRSGDRIPPCGVSLQTIL